MLHLSCCTPSYYKVIGQPRLSWNIDAERFIHGYYIGLTLGKWQFVIARHCVIHLTISLKTP